jgi:hypothetical protein
MAIAIVFLLGIANFALHRAVLGSGHAVVQAMVRPGGPGGKLTLALEFVLLLAAMLATSGSASWAWAYAIYSLCNGAAAWAILTGRI